MKKRLWITAILLLIVLLPFAAMASEAPKSELKPAPVPQKIDPATWPAKADWVGQQATLLDAKYYRSASYLLLYEKPGVSVPGVDQLALARTVSGKSLLIEGLYSLQSGANTRYYWHLTGEGRELWVRDTSEGRLEALPFALKREFEAETALIATLEQLAGKEIWFNRNAVMPSELTIPGKKIETSSSDQKAPAEVPITHLAPLTVVSLLPGGPFCKDYGFDLRTQSGELIRWKLGFIGDRPVYDHLQLQALFNQSFYLTDPRVTFPGLSDSLWEQIESRTISVGWTQDMVLLSWGTPENLKTVKKVTLWTYPGGETLTFEDKKLTSISVLPTPDPADPQKGKALKPVFVNQAQRK